VLGQFSLWQRISLVLALVAIAIFFALQIEWVAALFG
jgi:hypothetical protein